MKYTEDQIERAAEMREAGHGISHIAEALGMSRGAVDWHCLRRGADHPGARARAYKGPMTIKRAGHVLRRFSAEEDRKILAWEAEGLSICEIGRRLGRKHNSIIGRLATLARQDARREAAHG